MNSSVRSYGLIAMILAINMVLSADLTLQFILVPERVDAQNDIPSPPSNTTSKNQNLSNITGAETYIVTLNNQSSSGDLDDVIQLVKEKGANITHIYSHSIVGFSVQIPSDKKSETMESLVNDTRINSVEPDQTMTLSPPLE